MKKSPKSPKKQSAKITKLKMRVGEITSLLLQNNPKMVRMRKGGSSGYADLFMSKQLMKGGMNDDTQKKIVDFLNEVETINAVKALKKTVFGNDGTTPEIKKELYRVTNLYDYKLCDKYDDIDDKELQENFITLDIINKFYKLVKDKENPALNIITFVNDAQADVEEIGQRGEVDEEGQGVDGEQVAEPVAAPAAVAADEVAAGANGVGQAAEGAEAGAAKTPGGGKLPAKYKSLGIAVHILYKKRKYKRTIYVKDKKKTKYCKIDGEYILLSKMKVIA
jgi:hypothetical protein